MDAWKSALAADAEALPAARASKKPATSPDFNEKMRELLGVVSRMGLKNSQDLRSAMAGLYLCFQLTPNHWCVEAVHTASAAHNNKTRGHKGHKEGGPDPLAFMSLLVKAAEKEAQNIEEQDRASLDAFCRMHPPGGKGDIIQFAVTTCRLQKCWEHEKNGYKLFIQIRSHPGMPMTSAPGTLSKENVDNALMRLFGKSEGITQLMGQAPRGSLERRAQVLIDELGI